MFQPCSAYAESLIRRLLQLFGIREDLIKKHMKKYFEVFPLHDYNDPKIEILYMMMIRQSQ
jgi:hypothetical protein